MSRDGRADNGAYQPIDGPPPPPPPGFSPSVGDDPHKTARRYRLLHCFLKTVTEREWYICPECGAIADHARNCPVKWCGFRMVPYEEASSEALKRAIKQHVQS